MLRIIKGYSHKLGSHCASALMRDILDFYGLEVTEDLCFGIGAGLGFIYRKAFNPPLYFVLGRSDDLEEKICYHLGGMALRYTTDDTQRAWREVKGLIDKNNPALINVDASYLEYMRKSFNLFENVRYGGHRVMVIGYDEEEGTALLSDYLWNEPQKVTLQELKMARDSVAGQTPPENLFYIFLLPKNTIPLKEAIQSGIRLNVHAMLHPWYDVLGLPGLKKFCERLLFWPRFMQQQMAMKNAYITYMMFEVVGTGGGNFRRLYARFIHEAEDIFKDSRLHEVFKIYVRLGNLWKEVAFLLKESSEDISKGIWNQNQSCQPILDEILLKEKKGIYLLKEIFYE